MRRPMGVRGRLGGWAGGDVGVRYFGGAVRASPCVREFSGRKRGVKYMGVLGFAQGLVGAGGCGGGDAFSALVVETGVEAR